MITAPLILKASANSSSHLINNGVAESPPSPALLIGNSSTSSGLNPHDIFIGLQSTNVGFQHWHPVSVVEKGGKLGGQSDLGGVWEWTSTVLEKHQGFEAMELYPGYTGTVPLSLRHCNNLTQTSGFLR